MTVVLDDMVGEPPPYWDATAVAIAPDRMLLGPEAALIVAKALDRIRRADGVPLSPAVAHVRRVALSVAAAARGGHGDVPKRPDPAESGSWISTTEAALRLGLSARHVRRLAHQGAFGSVQTSGKNLRVQEAEVSIYAAGPPPDRTHYRR